MELDEIDKYIKEGATARLNIDKKNVYEAGNTIYKSMKNGGKLLIMGNGGSAADAQHIAAEFVGRFLKERRALPAMALHTNTSSITAIANDYSYEKVFSRQIEAFAKAGDVVLGISTSGNSKNVIEAMETAKSLGCTTIAMTGRSGGRLKEIADIAIKVDSNYTPIIQEMHITIGHIISKIVEDLVVKDESGDKP
ncbi:MAG: D-sedoheptulose 7-phosphate isomerase [Candidatus Micrarchaeia archaeon]